MKYLRKKDGKITIRKGFSFVEVILSVFVLSTGLLSVMALMTTNLRHSMESRKTIIASGLAQEAAELVINKAEDNIVKGGLSNQFNGLSDNDLYCIGLTASGVQYVANCSNFSLFFRDNGQLFYTHNSSGGGESTLFRRKVVIRSSGVGTDKTVTSFVWWGNLVTPTMLNLGTCTVANQCVYAQTLVVDKDGI